MILNDKSEYEKCGTHDDTGDCVSMKAVVVTVILYNNNCGTLFTYRIYADIYVFACLYMFRSFHGNINVCNVGA